MKKIVIISFVSLFIILSIILSILLIKKNSIKVFLNGKNTIKVEALTSFNDPLVTVKKGKNSLSKSKYKVIVKDNLDVNKVGTYEIDYKVKVRNKEYNLKRKIEVVDSIKPEITLSASEVVKDYCTKKNKTEITYSATDNYDNDITDKVLIEEVDDKIIYKVTDSSGNLDIKEVKINYESKPDNKFVLNGSERTTVMLGKNYTEKGASYTDGCGNKLDGNIKISGSVDTNKEGEYVITYTLNNDKTLTRTVLVKKYEPKNIYLTFDDGPGVNTKDVLNTLNKYNVKATFFVTNQFPSYQYLIAEEYKQGHSVGVHTLTHKWDVYDSLDAYLNDFNSMNEIIKNQTGSYTKIFRFPGGSSNTVSKKHSLGIVTAIAQEMTNRGYVYYDWNLSSGDADSKPTTEKIINNVLNKVDSCRYDCVILFHDYKKITANAIDPILAELTSRGYTFSTLDENGPVTHSKIAN